MIPAKNQHQVRSLPLTSTSIKLLVVCLAIATVSMALYVRVDSKSSRSTVAVQAAGRGKPYLNLEDGRTMDVSYRGDQALASGLQSGARSRALAAADLDGDAAPDLVAGYFYNGAGIVTIQRGNVEGFAPKDDSVFGRMQQGYNPDSLNPTVEAYQVSEPVDFLYAGDFDQDGRRDVLIAARGGNMQLLAGDGEGRLGAAKEIALPGTVNALTVGEFRAADGRNDIAVAINGFEGPEVLVFDGSAGGFAATPIRFALKEEAVAVEFGELDRDPFMDLAVATSSEINLIHGWGRKTEVKPEAQIERLSLSYSPQSIAIDNFLWDRQGAREIAVLSEDGAVHFLQHSRSDKRAFSETELLARAASRGRVTNRNVDVEAVYGWAMGSKDGWSEVNKLALNARKTAGAPWNLLSHGKISSGETNALMILNVAQKSLDVVHQVSSKEAATMGRESAVSVGDLSTTSLDVLGTPAAVLALPKKLNGYRDIVVLNAENVGAKIIANAPATIFNVNTISDHSPDGNCNAAPDCTFREAVIAANAVAGPHTINVPAGTYTLSIIGNTDASGSGEGFSGNAAIGDVDFRTDAITVTGAGSATTIIRQTTANDRTLEPNPNADLNFDWTISGVTIAGGRDTGGDTTGGGGAMLSGSKDNTTTIANCIIANNRATGTGTTGGGGISNQGGTVTITNTTIGGATTVAACPSQADLTCGNSTSASGGGIGYSPGDPFGRTPSAGTLTIQTTSSLQNNTANSLSAGGAGADLYTHNLGTGSVSITGTTFTSNLATGTASGGGIIIESIATTVATTSFTNNSAGNRGGGIYVGGGSLLLDGTSPSITFSGNTATTAGSSISAASAVNVSGTNTTIGGDLEITTNGVWTNNAGSTISPTNLIITGTGSFIANNSTTNVSGNFQFASGTFTAGTGLFNFNGTGAQSITNSSPITFNNLTDANEPQPLTANNSFAVNGTLTINVNAIFAPVASAVISGTGTLTGNGTARVTRTGADAFFGQYTIANKTLTNLTVEYIGGAAQTASTTTYGGLKINNGSGVTLGAGTTTVNGTLTLTAGALAVGANTLVINNGTSVGAGSLTSAATGTVNYNQGSNGQAVLAFNYGNLTFSNFNKSLAGTGTIGVAGTFTPGSATGHSIAGSTINFNGAGAQTVPVFNYNNLTISGARGGATVTLAAGTIGVAGTFTPSATAVVYSLSGNTIDFNGGGAQTIPAFNYNNLTSSNVGSRTLANSGTIGIAGVFTPGSNAYTITGSTIDFNGGGAQTIPAFNYNNLTSSNVGARTLANVGTIGIAGAFTPGTNTYTITGSTIDFNGAGPQTIPGFTYNNLTSSGGAAARTLDPINTIKIAGVFTPGTNVYTITGSTVEYNGTAPQTLPATFTTYNNLTLNNAAGVTGFAGLTVQGLLRVQAGTFTSSSTYNNVQIDAGATLAGTNATTINVSGNWTNNSATGLVANGNTVNFNGSGAQVIGGSQATTFNNLTIANAGAGVSLGQNINVNGVLTLTNDLTTGASILTMPASGSSTGAADVVGNVKRTGFTGGGPALSFGNPFNSIAFSVGGTLPTDVTVNLVKAAPSGGIAFPTAVQRTYTITPTGGSGFSATLRLHYLDAELNGNIEAQLGLWRFGAAWARQGRSAGDTTSNWVELSGVTQFSPWTLASGKNDTTTSITSDNPDPSIVGQVVTVNYSATSSVGGAPPLTGNVTITVNDLSGDTCTGTVAAGTCALTLTTLGSKTLTATYSGDANFNISNGTTPHEVVPLNVFVRDARAAEPTSGSANMLFTVTLSSPATGAASVNYATADGGGSPATGGTCAGGADYETTSGTVNFSAGQQVQTIPVVICSDGTIEGDETFLVNLSTPVNLTISDGQATGTITAANPAGEAFLNEVRTSGPGGAGDDFVELYNNSDSPVTVAADDASPGVGLFKMGAACGDTPILIGTIPNGTVIPARGHYLFGGSAYGLGAYTTVDQTLTADIENDRNIGFFSTTDVGNLSTETRLDAVGFGTNTGSNCDLLREGTNLQPAAGSTSQYSFVRKLTTGLPRDTNDNATDYGVVATDPTVAVGSNATPILGAPGPENLASPIQRNLSIKASLIDTAVASSAAPNRVRSVGSYTDTLTPSAPNGGAPGSNPYTLGTLVIRRKFTNNTGAPVTRLRFRIVDITSTNAPPGGGGQADLRALTSSTESVTITGGGSVTVQGLTLEQPPTQARGGGLNSSLNSGIVTPASPIAPGASINVNFLLGVANGGTFRFFVNVEALP